MSSLLSASPSPHTAPHTAPPHTAHNAVGLNGAPTQPPPTAAPVASLPVLNPADVLSALPPPPPSVNITFDPNSYELTDADRLFLENCRRGRLNPVEKFYHSHPHCLLFRSKVQRETPLMVAVKSGKTALVKFFIDKGIDLELMDKNELSALSHAIQEKNLIAVKLLVERGAKIHSMPDGAIHRTALSYAAKYGTLEMVQFLLPLLPEDKNLALLAAVACGQASKVGLLVNNGADVNFRADDYTPLSMAATLTMGDQVEIIQFLLAKGAQVNLTSLNGISPLMRACEGSKVAIMDLLIKNGADVHQESKEGRTPIFFVTPGAEKTCDAAYDLLLQNGAEINHKDKESSSCLIEVCKKSKNIGRIVYLITKGADVEYKSKEGKTALQYAKREIRQEVKARAMDYLKSTGLMSSTVENYLDELRMPVYRPRQSVSAVTAASSSSSSASSAANVSAGVIVPAVGGVSAPKGPYRHSIPVDLSNALIVYRVNHYDLLIRRAKKARNLELLERYVKDKKCFLTDNRIPTAAAIPESFRGIECTDVRSQLDWVLQEVNRRAEQLWDAEGSEDADVALIREVEILKESLERDLRDLEKHQNN